MIPNHQSTLDDIKNSDTVFGPAIPSLKGKMVIWKTKPVVSNYINTPKDVLQLHKAVLVVAGIMSVKGMALLFSISRHVKFTIVQYLGKRTTSNISKYLEKINDVYYRRGMYVEIFYIDKEFENFMRIIQGRSTLNITSAAEHVPEI